MPSAPPEGSAGPLGTGSGISALARATSRALAIVRGLAICLALASPAAAQTLTVGAGATEHGAAASVRLRGLRDAGATVDAWATFGAAVGGGATWRRAEVFGPLGNVIIEATAEGVVPLAAPQGPAGLRAAVGARGVLGAVAASLSLDGGTVEPDTLFPSLSSEAPRAALGLAPGQLDVGLRAGLTYRVDRAHLLTFDPQLRWLDGAWSAWAAGSLRRAAIAEELDLWMGAEGGVLAHRASGALGLGLIVSRRRQPDSWLRLWLGRHADRASPGLEALLAGRSAAGSATITLAWAPHRLEHRPWRVALDLATPAGGAGTWQLAAVMAAGAERPLWSLSLALERPLPPPLR